MTGMTYNSVRTSKLIIRRIILPVRSLKKVNMAGRVKNIRSDCSLRSKYKTSECKVSLPHNESARKPVAYQRLWYGCFCALNTDKTLAAKHPCHPRDMIKA